MDGSNIIFLKKQSMFAPFVLLLYLLRLGNNKHVNKNWNWCNMLVVKSNFVTLILSLLEWRLQIKLAKSYVVDTASDNHFGGWGEAVLSLKFSINRSVPHIWRRSKDLEAWSASGSKSLSIGRSIPCSVEKCWSKQKSFLNGWKQQWNVSVKCRVYQLKW